MEETQDISKPEIAWEASEYIHHEKDAMWFVIFSVSAVVIMAIIYLILRDILSVVVVGLMAVSLLVFANRKPRIMNYSINDDGISIGGKHYAYDFFRSFSVIKEGGVDSIVIDPMQRFLPPITMYFAPEDASHIVEVLSRHIPHEDKTPDIVDRFARRIRF